MADTNLSELLLKSEDLINLLPDGIGIMDLQGNVIFASKSLLKLFNIESFDQASSKNIFSYLTPDDLEKAITNVREVIRGNLKADHLREYKMVKPDGSPFFTEITSTIIRNEQGAPQSILFLMRDVTQKKMAEERIRRNEKKYRSLFENSNDAIFVAEIKSGMLVDANQKALEATGYTLDEVKTMHQIQLHPPEEIETVRMVFKQSIAAALERKNQLFHLSVIKKNGETFPVEISVGIFEEEDGTELIFGIFRDVSEQRSIIAELESSRDQLKKANLAKSEFLSNMSHELRTPLNGIIASTDLLEEVSSDADRKEYLDIIRQSGNNLLMMIDDILDITAIEEGKKGLHLDRFDLHKLTGELIFMFRDRAQEKELSFQVYVDSTIPTFLFGDESKLKQILANLIDNSIKFTDTGYVHLVIKEKSRIGNRIRLEFIVSDSGPGISPEKEPTIFAPFSQGEHFLTKKHGGTGLGLYLVKKLLSLIKGDIQYTTGVDTGTSFFVNLSFEIVSDDADSHFTHPIKELMAKNLKIIIADDNKSNHLSIQQIFSSFTPYVTLVENGFDVIKHWKKETQDIIFMDIHMPVLNGLDTVKIIRSIESSKKLPSTLIVGISDPELAEDMQKALDFGMDECMRKPFSLEDVMHVIRKLLQS